MKYFIKKNGTFLSASYDMQRKEPHAEFKMYEWDGWMNMKVVQTLEECECLDEVNWNWDRKYIPMRDDEDDDWDIT